MPTLRNGGIFIPTTRSYNLGDEVFMLLSLMDDPIKLPIAGTVVWITPPGAQNSKAQGIGVHFKNDESGIEAKRKIEGMLGGVMQSTRPTHTLKLSKNRCHAHGSTGPLLVWLPVYRYRS